MAQELSEGSYKLDGYINWNMEREKERAQEQLYPEEHQNDSFKLLR